MKAKHVGIIIWVIVAVAFIFCFWYFGIKNIVSSDEPEDDESGINTFNYSCPHDDTYQEPTCLAFIVVPPYNFQIKYPMFKLYSL